MNPPQVYLCSPSCTLLPPPSPYHLSGVSQCTSPKHPVSCIEPGLATRFIHDILHVSMPFSQIFPPSPSPTESVRLFYIKQILLYVLLEWMWRIKCQKRYWDNKYLLLFNQSIKKWTFWNVHITHFQKCPWIYLMNRQQQVYKQVRILILLLYYLIRTH